MCGGKGKESDAEAAAAALAAAVAAAVDANVSSFRLWGFCHGFCGSFCLQTMHVAFSLPANARSVLPPLPTDSQASPPRQRVMPAACRLACVSQGAGAAAAAEDNQEDNPELHPLKEALQRARMRLEEATGIREALEAEAQNVAQLAVNAEGGVSKYKRQLEEAAADLQVCAGAVWWLACCVTSRGAAATRGTLPLAPDLDACCCPRPPPACHHLQAAEAVRAKAEAALADIDRLMSDAAAAQLGALSPMHVAAAV